MSNRRQICNDVLKDGGFKRISANAREMGTNIPHERLAFDGVDQLQIKEPGYVYIWLSNENETAVEVYFAFHKVIGVLSCPKNSKNITDI
jgi:hypothetical protein